MILFVDKVFQQTIDRRTTTTRHENRARPRRENVGTTNNARESRRSLHVRDEQSSRCSFADVHHRVHPSDRAENFDELRKRIETCLFPLLIISAEINSNRIVLKNLFYISRPNEANFVREKNKSKCGRTKTFRKSNETTRTTTREQTNIETSKREGNDSQIFGSANRTEFFYSNSFDRS